MRKKNNKTNKADIDENNLPFEDGNSSGFSNTFNHLEAHAPIYLGIFLLFLSVFSISSMFGLGGNFGRSYFLMMVKNFGGFTYLFPIVYAALSFIFVTRNTHVFKSLKLWSIVILLVSLFILIGFFKLPDGLSFSGLIGGGISELLKDSFGIIPSIFLLLLINVLSLAKIFETSLEEILHHKFSFKKAAVNMENTFVEEMHIAEENLMDVVKQEKNYFASSKLNPLNWFNKKSEALSVRHLKENNRSDDLYEQEFKVDENGDQYEEVEVEDTDSNEDQDVRSSMYKAVSVDMPNKEREKKTIKKIIKKDVVTDAIETKKENAKIIHQVEDVYRRPPIDLFIADSGKASAGDNKENARIIKRTLSDFGISVEMDEVTVGPTVTRYALKPAQGVKIEKIINLANNIALELGVSSVSITRVQERSLIGIEVPNKQKAKLGIASLLNKKDFLDRKDRLTIALGKDIYGDAVLIDGARMPHLLIAGTTGSGKSSLIHGIINSLTYKNSPYELKFILIDPKKVEFAMYSKLPHLLTPVIKEPKKAIQTLNWLVQEMDRRYQILEDCGKQNIGSYHSYVAEKYNKALSRSGELRDKGTLVSETKLPEKMPFIVLVIDELADFMMKYPKEMESGIVKLAQMSRAVGIHLILATQRPSTNVITGVIKGNIPSRVALRVASQVDSRVIIDQGGAEKLLGFGDMLFMGSDGSEVKRIQAPFVSEEEIKEVVAYLRTEYDDLVAEELKNRDGNIVGAQNVGSGSDNAYGQNGNSGPVSDADFNEEDEKYEDAKQIVQQTKKTSISNLQVRLGTGYARSAKLINMLEQAGVIINVTDNNGKQVKAVAGTQSEKLEAEADKLLQGNGNNSGNVEANEDDDKEDEDINPNQRQSSQNSSFFKF